MRQETDADNSCDIDMTDTALISPSSSPGQPAGVVLPLPVSPRSNHLSPPPTPSESSRQDCSSLFRCDDTPNVSVMHCTLRNREFRGNTGKACGHGNLSGEQFKIIHKRSEGLSEDGDTAEGSESDSVTEEVIDVIGDDTDTQTETPPSDTNEDNNIHRDESCSLDNAKKSRKLNDENSNRGRQPQSPTSVTNFSIAAILKPDFGPTRKLLLECHSARSSRLSHRGNNVNIRSTFELPAGFLSLYNHRQSAPHRHHHHSPQVQGLPRLQMHQLLQPRLSTTSPSPVDLSIRSRSLHQLGPCSNKALDKRSSGLTCNKPAVVANDSDVKKRRSSQEGLGKGKKAVVAADASTNSGGSNPDSKHLWPAWVFCTRYSDRPSSGPRSRRMKRRERSTIVAEEKRPRTAFTSEQLSRLKREFDDCRYLTEARRRHLATELGLTESQIKIWFQNKRAKIKKSSGVKNELAMQLMAQGLYNHSTVAVEEEGDVRKSDDDVTVC